jgi:hypothetical protein
MSGFYNEFNFKKASRLLVVTKLFNSKSSSYFENDAESVDILEQAFK